MKRTKLLALACLLAGAAAVPAVAQTFNGNAIYKVTRSNGTPSIIVANRSPGERVTVTFPNALKSRRVTANACGLITLRDTSSNPLANLQSVDGETIDQSALPTQLLPRCVDGTLEEARAAHFKTGAGEVVLVKTPNTVYPAVYSGGKTANATVNACGFAQMNTTSSRDLTTAEYSDFEVDGTAYSISTLPEASPEPLCRSGNLYLPNAWP
jgi:hypothetical protein